MISSEVTASRKVSIFQLFSSDCMALHDLSVRVVFPDPLAGVLRLDDDILDEDGRGDPDPGGLPPPHLPRLPDTHTTPNEKKNKKTKHLKLNKTKK